MRKLSNRYGTSMSNTVQKMKEKGPIGKVGKAIGSVVGAVASVPANRRGARYGVMADTMREARKLDDMPINLSTFNPSSNEGYNKNVKTKLMSDVYKNEIGRENLEARAKALPKARGRSQRY